MRCLVDVTHAIVITLLSLELVPFAHSFVVSPPSSIATVYSEKERSRTDVEDASFVGQGYGRARDAIRHRRLLQAPDSLVRISADTTSTGVVHKPLARWKATSASKACESNYEGIVRTSYLEEDHARTLEQCMEYCVETPKCISIDFYRDSGWCNLYDRICTTPLTKTDGASSYHRDDWAASVHRDEVVPNKRLASKLPCPFDPPSTPADNGGWPLTFELVAKDHVDFDKGFGEELIRFLGKASVADVGAGVGQLKRFLQAHPNNVTDYQGFDAAYNIQEFWGMPAPLGGNENYLVPHKICYLDASQPLPQKLPKGISPADWVVSIEVGSYVAKEREDAFFDNLVRLANTGIIVSWALPGQDGEFHRNLLDNDQVIAQMERRCMEHDEYQSARSRESVSQWPWLRKTLLVFRKCVHFDTFDKQALPVQAKWITQQVMQQVGYTALVVVIIVFNGILLVAFLALWWILGVKVMRKVATCCARMHGYCCKRKNTTSGGMAPGKSSLLEAAKDSPTKPPPTRDSDNRESDPFSFSRNSSLTRQESGGVSETISSSL